ncbi:MAG: DUF1761 domain-containing protein [Reichenbachiella sp.]|uniref:DUF1761 domain-containing protein n=1 Tax=Reichenbachiella sp. TaxID=2184521 RepID=UPI0032632961
MELPSINYLAVLVAALSTFLIGGLWYSPVLFGKIWQQDVGLSDEELKKGNPAKIFGGAFVLGLIMSFNLAAFLGSEPDLMWGIVAGLLAGAGWIAAAMGVTYLFERRSMRFFLINAGYHVVSFVVMGAILGVWK